MAVAGVVQTLETEVDVERQRTRHPFRAGVEASAAMSTLTKRAACSPGCAREREQLIRQPHRAIGGRAQFTHRGQAFAAVARDGRLLRMQFDGGERRAQLMGGVGDEFALGRRVRFSGGRAARSTRR